MRTKKMILLLLSSVHMCADHIRTAEWDGPRGGVWRGAGDCYLSLLVGTTGCSATAHKIHQAFRVACSEQVSV